MFRLEVWVRKNMEENKLKELENYLGEKCPKVTIKDISN